MDDEEKTYNDFQQYFVVADDDGNMGQGGADLRTLVLVILRGVTNRSEQPQPLTRFEWLPDIDRTQKKLRSGNGFIKTNDDDQGYNEVTGYHAGDLTINDAVYSIYYI